MDDATRGRFDEAVGRVIDRLPDHLRRLIGNEIAVIVEDAPTPAMLEDLGISPDDPSGDEILGLHTGVMLTEASVEETGPPTVIHLFRRGLLSEAATPGGQTDPAALEEEIRVTLLHELGHHFGLEEDDLEDLGYA